MAGVDAAFYPTKDFAYGTVLTAPSPASSGTSLVLNSAEGLLFPNPATEGAFRAYVWPVGETPTTTNCEEIEVTAKSTDTFTIVRSKNGVTRSILVGDQVAINFGKSKEDQFLLAIKEGVIEDKLLPGESYSRDSTTQFKTPGDKTAWYTKGRIVRINNSGTYTNHVVVSSSYSAPDTTVIVRGTAIPAAITSVFISLETKGVNGFDRFTRDIVDLSRFVLPDANFPAIGKTIGTNLVYASLAFDKDTSEAAYFTSKVPFFWSGFARATIYWTAASGSGNVTWDLDHLSRADDEALDTALSNADTVTDTLLAAGDIHVAQFELTTTGWAADEYITFKLSRDISDTLSVDALLLKVVIEFF